MKRLTRNPFGTFKSRFVPVVAENCKTLYLLALGSITPDINPIDYQELTKRQAELTDLVLEAISVYQKQTGVDESAAREAFFPTQTNGKAQIVPVNPLDYLSSDSRAKFFALQSEGLSSDNRVTSPLEIKAATLLIRYRVGFDIEVVKPAKVKANKLEVNDIWFPVLAGDRFKIDNQIITVAEDYDSEESPNTLVIEPLTYTISSNSVLFKLKEDSNQFEVGYGDPSFDSGMSATDEGWTIEDTKSMLPEPLIKALYGFYLEEQNGGGKHMTLDQMKSLLSSKNVKTLEDTLIPLQLNGETFSLDSNTSDAENQDSQASLLEVAPLG